MIFKRTYPDTPILLVDTGNMTDNPTPEGDVKTHAIVDGMARMGYQALGVGERDLDRGFDYLDGLRKTMPFPLISGNALYQKSGERVFQASTVVTFDSKNWKAIPGKQLRVGVTSLMRFNPTFLKPAPNGDNIVIGNPIDEARSIIPDLRKKSDFVVVVAALPKDGAHMLAKAVPGIDLIVCAYGGIVSIEDEFEGTTRILYIGTQGKNLGEVRAQKLPTGWQTSQTLHFLGSTYPEDPKMREIVTNALGQINETNKAIAAERQKRVEAAGGAGSAALGRQDKPAFVGAETCKTCHGDDYAVWSGSKHAHAFDILVAKKTDFNPDCVGCHVTGFRSRGGFEDASNTPTLKHVQCESCHGAGAAHVQDPSVPYGKTSGDTTCLSCHTRENSPSYSFDVYWPKIEHGKK